MSSSSGISGLNPECGMPIPIAELSVFDWQPEDEETLAR